jgi:hypothetical protein
MTRPVFRPLTTYREVSGDEMKCQIRVFRDDMLRRRTVRQFSCRPVPREVIEDCLQIAGSAPSGANLQPWHFVVISDLEVKRQIREAAEKEEYFFTMSVHRRNGWKRWLHWEPTNTSLSGGGPLPDRGLCAVLRFCRYIDDSWGLFYSRQRALLSDIVAVIH